MKLPMNSKDCANTPSLFGQFIKKKKKRTEAEQNRFVELYASRVAANLDIWSGLPRQNVFVELETETPADE
jgi:hypothetical protein